jgi:hypothetical protein
LTILSLENLAAPVADLGELGAEALAEWRWLVPPTSRPVLMTALGDLFLQADDGSIEFLDTAAGTLTHVGASYTAWKVGLSPEWLGRWFMPEFVAELVASGTTLKAGEVYSPIIPEVLGGKRAVTNYSASPWTAHLHVLGSVHRQVKDLPAGTPVTAVHVDPW